MEGCLGYARMLNIVDKSKGKTPQGKGWKVKWAEEHKQEASLVPSLKRRTNTAGGTTLVGEQLQRMMELNKTGYINKKLIGQKYSARSKHMQVALFMLNPKWDGDVKRNIQNRSGRLKGMNDSRVAGHMDDAGQEEEARLF